MARREREWERREWGPERREPGWREREWHRPAERPWYTKGIERAERPRPAAGAPRVVAWYEYDYDYDFRPHRVVPSRVRDRYRPRPGRERYVPASEVPRGRPERWWYAIGPERREDYDWAYSARRPERYGWTGETGRDGGPGAGRGGWRTGRNGAPRTRRGAVPGTRRRRRGR